MTRLSQARVRLARRYRPLANAPAAQAGQAPGTFGGTVALGVWFGLATGLLELLLLVVRREIYTAAALGALQINQHYPWMIPAANAAIFGACGLALGLLGRLAPRAVARRAVPAFVFLATLTLLLALQRLHAGACVVLALAVAVRLGPRLRARVGGPGRLVRVGLPLMLVGVSVLAGRTYDRLVRAEARALLGLPKPAPATPNVLLVVLDTVRADHLSLYGYGRQTSPNLARLAARGVRFEHARSTAPWTLPSHASLFTGRWPHELFAGPHRPLDATYPTLAEFLGGLGYETAGFVANYYYCNSWFGLGRGFVHYDDHIDGTMAVSPGAALRCSELGRRVLRAVGNAAVVPPRRKDAARINRDFLGWLSTRGGDRPFFAFLNYLDAHDPYVVPEGAVRRFGLVPGDAGEAAVLCNWIHLDKRRCSAREVALARDAYDDCLAYLDDQLGRLFDALERRGVLDNTLVIVTSDHGEHLGEHELYGHGLSLYRAEVGVPLLVFAPAGVPSGTVVRQPVSLRDVPATVVDRLGLASRSPFPGRTLARCWESPGDESASPPLSEMAHDAKHLRPGSRIPAERGRLEALAEGSKVYIRCGDGGEELYDLESDPAEAHNLAGRPGSRPVVESFRGTLSRLTRGGE